MERNIELAFVFGSVARGNLREGSDLDVALLLRRVPSPQKRLTLRTKVADKLSSLFGRETEVIFLNNAGSILKYQVARDGKLLFERHKSAEKKFRLNAIKEFFDYLPIFNFHYQRHGRAGHGRHRSG